MRDALGFFKSGIAFCQVRLATLDAVVELVELLGGEIESSAGVLGTYYPWSLG